MRSVGGVFFVTIGECFVAQPPPGQPPPQPPVSLLGSLTPVYACTGLGRVSQGSGAGAGWLGSGGGPVMAGRGQGQGQGRAAVAVLDDPRPRDAWWPWSRPCPLVSVCVSVCVCLRARDCSLFHRRVGVWLCWDTVVIWMPAFDASFVARIAKGEDGWFSDCEFCMLANDTDISK